MKLLSLFSGIGAFEKALDNLGIKYELVNYCEIDKYASLSYSLIHNVSESKNLGDITKVDTSKFPKEIDLITFGFPCVPKGFKVKTSTGFKNIEDITTQDKVLTHTNTYQKVLVTMSRISDHINKIKGVGCYGLQLTDEHPVYVYRNNKFEWVKTKDLTTKDNLVYNINTNKIKVDCTDDELWLLGRYCADGYRENHSLKRPIFCIGSHKVDEFEEHLQGIEYKVAHQERSCIEYKILDEKLSNILNDFGTGSTKKVIPNWVIDLPIKQLKIFLNGYLSGDGHKRKDRNITMFCTASEKMFLSLQEIIIKVHRVVPTVNVRYDKRSETFSNTYNGQFSNNPKNQTIINDKIIVPIKSIERIEKDIEVFNFEVENDNSYTVDNVIVHNCQDISLAGKQQGFQKDDGSTTRSGLFFEALRIIEDTKPRIAIAENVKNLVSKKFNKEFNIVLSSLDKAGYNSYFEVLNSKDFGIPQNRERVFIVSIRKDIDKFNFFEPFMFPRKQELKLRLKDLLESQVDEKYYLSDNFISRIVDWKSQQKPLEKVLGEKSISPTLTARGAGEEHSRMILYSDNLENTTDLQNECLKIKEKTKKGYALATDGDGVYVNRPHQKRGVVQKGMIQTIKTSPDVGVVVNNNNETLKKQLCNKLVESGVVQENYVINHSYTNGLTGKNPNSRQTLEDFIETTDNSSPCLTTRADTLGVVVKNEINPVLVGGIGERKSNSGTQFYQQDRVYDSSSIAMCHPANLPGGSYKYLVKDKAGNEILLHNDTKQLVETIQNCELEQGKALNLDLYNRASYEESQTLTLPHHNTQRLFDGLRIRKLTPKECFRLMGFSDDDFEKVNGKLSDTQLYKQAGNSIVVNVLMALFKRLQDEGLI